MWGVLPSPKTGRLTNNRKLLVLGPVVTCAVVHGFPSGPTSQAPGGPRRNFMSWSRRHRPCEILRCPTQSHRACSLLTSLHRFSSTHTQPPNTYHAQSKKQDPNLKKKHIIHLGVRFLPPPPHSPKLPVPETAPFLRFRLRPRRCRSRRRRAPSPVPRSRRPPGRGVRR